MSKTWNHRAYGLEIQSDFPLAHYVPGEGSSQVSITKGECPASLADPLGRGVLWQAKKNELLLNAPEGSSFWVKNGQEIIVQAKSNSFHRFLYGSVMGALLQQRGLLTLHAGGFTAQGKAYLVLGGSGHGKSTTLAAVNNLGFPMLCENIAALGPNLLARPESKILKLWPDSAKALGYEERSSQAIVPSLEKRVWEISNRATTALPVAGIIKLVGGAENTNFQDITGLERTQDLITNIFRKKIARAMGKEKEHMALLSGLSQVPFLRATWGADKKYSEFAQVLVSHLS